MNEIEEKELLETHGAALDGFFAECRRTVDRVSKLNLPKNTKRPPFLVAFELLLLVEKMINEESNPSATIEILNAMLYATDGSWLRIVKEAANEVDDEKT